MELVGTGTDTTMSNLISATIKTEQRPLYHISFDLTAGADHSGIPFTVIISSSFDKPLVYIRNSNKKHGKQNKTEGKISGGEDAVIFTDYYSSSSKVDFAEEALKESDVKIKAIVTIFNYNFQIFCKVLV